MDHSLRKKKQIQKSKETWDSKYIYQKEPDKACFQHDLAYSDFKDLLKRTKVLCDKRFKIAKNLKYDGYHADLLRWFIILLIKNYLVVLSKVKLWQTNNYLKNYNNQLYENYIHLLLGIFRQLILQICNQ